MHNYIWIGHAEFKDSKVGRIPQGWDIVVLATISNITSSKRIYKSDYQETGIPFLEKGDWGRGL